MLKVFDVQQGSEEWHKLRCGVPTSSEFDKIVTTKGEPSKQREKYLFRLAGERVSGICEVPYQSEAMLRGKKLEDEGRKYYEFRNRTKVALVGFCLQEYPGYGCSPDGIVGKPGLLEIKVPLLSTHVKYLLDRTLPIEYFVQLQGQLLVTGKDWCDFMSYAPGMKPLIVRVKKDKKFITKLEAELKKFCAELKQVVRRLE